MVLDRSTFLSRSMLRLCLAAVLGSACLAADPAAAAWDPLFRTGQYFGAGFHNSAGGYRYNSPHSLAIADFDGNSLPDIAVGGYAPDIMVLMHETFTSFPQMFPTVLESGSPSSTQVRDVAAGDLNLDGRPDLIWCIEETNSLVRSVVVRLRTSTGFGPPTTYVVDGAVRVAAGDVNGDGRPDVVLGAFTGVEQVGVKVMLSNPDGSLGAPATYAGAISGDVDLPKAMVLADVTGDGIPDVVLSMLVDTGASFESSLLILQGDGAGGFPTALPLVPTETISPSIAVGQLNGDGIPDIAVVAGSLNHVSAYFGTGGGAFQAPVHNTVAITPGSVCAGDVDGDGDKDLVAVTSDPVNVLSSVGLLRNNGNGTFAPAVLYGGLPGAGEAVLADMDLDGRLDLVAAILGGPATQFGGTATDLRTHVVGLLWNDGAGGFRGSVAGPSFVSPQTEAIADFNRDGLPDLAIADASSVWLALGQGTGAFGTPTLVASVPAGVQGLVVGDLDRNGAPDMVVGGNSSPTSILVGNGAGAFSVRSALFNGRPVAIYDGNRDGAMDLLTSSGTSITFHQCSSPDLTSYLPGTSVTASTGVNAVAVGDWNRDGVPDVVAVGNGGIGTFQGQTSGALGAQSLVMGGRVYNAVCAADFNGDGTLDLAARENIAGVTGVGVDFRRRGIDVFSGVGDGTFTLAYSAPTLECRGGTIASADVNLDGKPDLVVGGVTDAINNAAPVSSFDLLLNAGDAQFGASVSYALGSVPAGASSPRGFAFGDVDRNSVPDVIAPVLSGPSTFAYHSVLATPPARSTLLRQATLYPTVTGPSSVALGDVNRDGRLDVVVGAQNTDPGVALFLGTSTGALGTNTTLPQSGNAGTVKLADLNRDGILDLVTSRAGITTPRVSTMLGVGNGTFGARNDYFLAANEDFEIGDMNRDGFPDVVTSAHDSIRVLLAPPPGGTFVGGASLSLAGATISDIDLADLNRDGYLDVVVAAGTVKVLYGTSSGNLMSPVTLTAPLTNCQTLAIADINRDGFLDIVASSGTVYDVIWGASVSPFTTFASTTLPFGALDLNAGEAAADGKPYLYLTRNADGLEVYSVSPAGVLTSAASQSFVVPTPYRVALGDLDRDGMLDVVITGSGSSQIAVLLHGLSITTAVETPPAAAPRIDLRQNYPNPFNPRTTIRYTLSRAERVQLRVFDVRGRFVTTLRDGSEPAGERRVEWDGRDREGQPVASGVYLYRLTTESGEAQSRRMLVVK